MYFFPSSSRFPPFIQPSSHLSIYHEVPIMNDRDEGGAEGGFKDVDERIPHLKELPVSKGICGSGTSECPSELGRGRRMKTELV